MLARRRIATWPASAVAGLLVLAAGTLEAAGSKPPTYRRATLVLTATANATFVGSCQGKGGSKPSPSLAGVLTVWDASSMADVPVPLTLRPVLADKEPTGEFVFDAKLSVPELELGFAPLAGRLHLTGVKDCTSFDLTVLIQDALGSLAPYALHLGP